MAIDAMIMGIKQDGNDLLLVLGPRIYTANTGVTASTGSSIPGRHVLRIEDFTYMPTIGQCIWGGADTARTVANIVGTKAVEYKFTARGTLKEA